MYVYGPSLTAADAMFTSGGVATCVILRNRSDGNANSAIDVPVALKSHAPEPVRTMCAMGTCSVRRPTTGGPGQYQSSFDDDATAAAASVRIEPSRFCTTMLLRTIREPGWRRPRASTPPMKLSPNSQAMRPSGSRADHEASPPVQPAPFIAANWAVSMTATAATRVESSIALSSGREARAQTGPRSELRPPQCQPCTPRCWSAGPA